MYGFNCGTSINHLYCNDMWMYVVSDTTPDNSQACILDVQPSNSKSTLMYLT